MTSPENITPQQQLANSRDLIVGYMTRKGENGAAGNTRADHASGSGTPGIGGVWKMFKHGANVWWRHHPAHLALDVATGVAKPMLSKYAKEKPVQLLGVAACIGAAMVWVKPWRFVSATGLLLAAIKSPGWTPAFLSLVSVQPESTNLTEEIPKADWP